MKKSLVFSLAIALTLVFCASPAFALQCKTGNWGSDECWTNVKVASGETTVVTAGTILVYDFMTPTGTSVDNSSFVTRVSTVSTQNNLIAGVAQKTIASGDRGDILVRGKGKIKLCADGATSADRLFVSSTAGAASDTPHSDVTDAASHDSAIAFALETGAASTTIDAYIVVI